MGGKWCSQVRGLGLPESHECSGQLLDGRGPAPRRRDPTRSADRGRDELDQRRSGVLAGTNVTVRFSEPLAPNTVNDSTVQLRDAYSQLVAAYVTWDPI